MVEKQRCLARRFLWIALLGFVASGYAQDLADSNAVQTADVVLADAPLRAALTLIARRFELPIVAGDLPDITVSLHLEGVTGDEVLDALATIGGLSIERRGKLILIQTAEDVPVTTIVPDDPVSPVEPEPEPEPVEPPPPEQRLLVGPFPPAAEILFAAGPELGVSFQTLDADLVAVEGPLGRLQQIVDALAQLRKNRLEQRTFRLGYARGQELLEAAQLILDPLLEGVSYDADDNLLTVAAQPGTMQKVAELVEVFERGLPQIEIEAQILEVGTDALERIGVEWRLRFGLRGGSIPSTFFLKGVDDAQNFLPSPSQATALDDQANQAGNAGQGGGDGSFVFHRIDFRQTSVLLELIEQSGESRVLANPRVTTLHNRPASIRAVERVLIPRLSFNDDFGTTTTTGLDTVTVGTLLSVTPRVDAAGDIFLRVVPEISEVLAFNDGLPVTTERSATTEVLLHNGETFVIGGLIREKNIENVTKLPFFGDIPGLGAAFTFTETETQQRELLIFLTPHVLPTPNERQTLTRIDNIWLPNRLATELGLARALLTAADSRERMRGLDMLRRFDGELLAAGLDVELDVWELREDAEPEARALVARFMAERRPEKLFDLLPDIPGSPELAAQLLALPLAPHLRLALAELLAGDSGGSWRVAARLKEAEAAHDVLALERLARATAVMAADSAEVLLAGLLEHSDRGVVTAALDALAVVGSPLAASACKRFADSPDAELCAHGRALSDLARNQDPRESVLAWTAPAEAATLGGDADFQKQVRAALAYLEQGAPDYGHFVRHAFASIDPGPDSRCDPLRRSLKLSAADCEDHVGLAQRLIYFSSCVYFQRTLGFPVDDQAALARGLRTEVAGLERLSDASCERARLDAIVSEVLLLDAEGRE